MKMDDMNKYFEARGFKVKRIYEPGDDCNRSTYRFDISKGDKHLSGFYCWPSNQKDFMEGMIRSFDAVSRRNDAMAAYSEACGAYYDAIARASEKCQSAVRIEKVVFNAPATIVMWADGTKTVVKCDNETFDPEKGLAMAISKKALGNKGNYYNTFTKWLKEDK